MPTIDRSILVAAPVRRVFDFVAEPANAVRYQKQFSKFDVVDHARRGVGMEVDARGRFHGIPVRTRLRMVEFVQDELMASQSVSGLKASSQWRFSPEAGGTRVRFTARYEWPLPIFSRRLRIRMEEELESMTVDSLRTLKELVESGPEESPTEDSTSPAESVCQLSRACDILRPIFGEVQSKGCPGPGEVRQGAVDQGR